jgi:hypothetical protein
MRLCYGWWAASYREQSEKQLGALYDVRATSVWFLHGLYHAEFDNHLLMEVLKGVSTP